MNKKVIIVIFGLFLLQLWVASSSSFGHYHGWNEGTYATFGEKYYNEVSLLEQTRFNDVIYKYVPPVYGWLVFLSFKIFGVSDLSARIVTVFAELISVIGIWIIGKTLYSERVANFSAIVFMILPWNVLWYSRTAPDGLMVSLMILSVALYILSYKNNWSMLPFGLVFGLGVMTKQPVFVVIPIVLIWSYFEGIKSNKIADALIWMGVGIIPLMWWLSTQPYEVANEYFHIWGFYEPPFADAVRVSLFTLVGVFPLIIFAKKPKTLILIWLIIYGIFMIVRTPISHEYYSLPIIAPLSIMIGDGVSRLKWDSKNIVVMMLLVSLPFTLGLLHYAGSLGYTSTRDVASFIDDYKDNNKGEYRIYIQMIYEPQMWFYLKNETKEEMGDGEEFNEEWFKIMKSDGRTSLFVTDETDKMKQMGYEDKKIYSSIYNWDIIGIGKWFSDKKELSVYRIDN